METTIEARASAGLLVLACALAACSHGGNGPSDGVAVTFDGEWNGTWSSAGPAPSGVLTLRLDQVGARISGAATFVGHPCIAACDVDCQADGEEIRGWFDAGPFRMAIDGFCPGPHHGGGHRHDDLSGTYEILGGACAGEHGTFDLTRVVDGVADGAQSAHEMGATLLGEVILIRMEDGETLRLPLIAPSREGR